MVQPLNLAKQPVSRGGAGGGGGSSSASSSSSGRGPTRVAQVFCARQRAAAVHLLDQAAQAPGIHPPGRPILDGLQ
jgi:hypothetical protein